jgi:hypothetical protein
VFDDTTLVVTVNVAVVALASTVTLAGTCAAAVLLLDRVTIAPLADAGPVNVTVPIEFVPPTTDAGFSVIDPTAGALTVKFAVCVAP